MCGLTLAWVTSENSTSTGMPTSFDSIFFAVAGPSLLCYCLRSRPHLPVVPRQLCWLCCRVANCLPAPLSSQPSFVSPYHFRIRRDFRSKNPLSGFMPKQTKEPSARATHIVLQLYGIKYSYLIQLIFRQIYLTLRWNSSSYNYSWSQLT